MSLEKTPLPAPKLAEASFYKDGHHVAVLTDDALAAACGVRIAFTTRQGGVSKAPYASLNLGDHVDDDIACVECNRELLMGALSVPAASLGRLLVPKQVHGDAIVELGRAGSVEAAQAQTAAGADGIVCLEAGVPVLLVFADCVPVIVVAPTGDFAVLHAGWRGAIAGIAGKGAARLAAAAGFSAASCNAYIGPHIGACCYETSAQILERFVERYGQACDAGARHLDLTAAVSASLAEAGVRRERICDSMSCTSCSNDRFFSYRADGGTTGRHGAFAFRGAILGAGYDNN